ncbi:MAG: ATP-binding protein, partial [Gammaproteobacteria bacterium]
DMLATAENVMERMQGLLLQLRAGNKPVEKPVPVKLAEVLQAAVAARRGLRPEPLVTIDDGVATRHEAASRTLPGPARLNGTIVQSPVCEAATIAHRDRLERVIGHLVQNAAEACGPDGRVELRLRRDGEQALIEVEDNGPGMSDAFVRERLFRPFESTKAHGMGIGAFESREYLREIGGALEVSSREGVGTLLRIRLPLAMGSMNG